MFFLSAFMCVNKTLTKETSSQKCNNFNSLVWLCMMFVFQKYASSKGENFIKMLFFKPRQGVLKVSIEICFLRSMLPMKAYFAVCVTYRENKIEKLELMKRKASKCTNVSPAPGCLEGPPCHPHKQP